MRFFKCNECGTGFTEEDQTISDYRDGKCPACKSDDTEEQVADAERAAICSSRLSRVYLPKIDWDAVRQAKLLCRNCKRYDHFNLGCKLWLLPVENCSQRVAIKLDKRKAKV